MTQHKFSVEDAGKYGVYKAILLEHLRFHQQANSGNPDLIFEGKVHAFLKSQTIKKMYPYLNPRSVRRWLLELEDEGVIESRKPAAKQGNHLKFYHVKNYPQCFPQSNGHCDQSNGQNDQSMNGQNDQSTIVTYVNKPYVGNFKKKSTFFVDKFYTQSEILHELHMRRIQYSELENYFEITNKKRGKLALWKPK